jgi:hypothetical protein
VETETEGKSLLSHPRERFLSLMTKCLRRLVEDDEGGEEELAVDAGVNGLWAFDEELDVSWDSMVQRA